MPRKLAQLTSRQARKRLLVATVQVQRAQLRADIRWVGSIARDVSSQARQRLQWVTIATSAIGLLIAVATARQPRDPSRNGDSPLLARALPLLRLALSLWIAHRTGVKAKTQA